MARSHSRHGYVQLHGAAMGYGALPAPIKELIALAIAVTRECDGCIVSHTRSAAWRGATAQEVAETMGVAILMNGCPGTVWGPRAQADFEEFAAAASPCRGEVADLGYLTRRRKAWRPARSGRDLVRPPKESEPSTRMRKWLRNMARISRSVWRSW